MTTKLADATTCGMTGHVEVACAGPRLSAELDAVQRATLNPSHPVVAVVGGSSLWRKLPLMEALAQRVDVMVAVGAIGNSFLAASGIQVGASLAEPGAVEELTGIAKALAARSALLVVPDDVVVAKSFREEAHGMCKPANAVAKDDMIFDIGRNTAHRLAALIRDAGTLIWYGAPGIHEFGGFSAGTQALLGALAEARAFTIACGGDTTDLVRKIDGLAVNGRIFLTHGDGLWDLLEARFSA